MQRHQVHRPPLLLASLTAGILPMESTIRTVSRGEARTKKAGARKALGDDRDILTSSRFDEILNTTIRKAEAGDHRGDQVQ